MKRSTFIAILLSIGLFIIANFAFWIIINVFCLPPDSLGSIYGAIIGFISLFPAVLFYKYTELQKFLRESASHQQKAIFERKHAFFNKHYANFGAQEKYFEYQFASELHTRI